MNYVRPPLTDYQREIIDSRARYTVTEGTTKAGKTISHLIWLFEETLRAKGGFNTWWTAPVYSQAEIAYNRLKRIITSPDVFKPNDSRLCLTFANGAKMFFKSAEKPDKLYGEDVVALALDEFTRMREESWFALRSTITATGGKAKFIGNVAGTNNWGYKLARKVESREMGKDWEYFKVTADDAVKAGILPQSEIDDAKNTLPQGVFLELFYGIPNESSSNRFCYSFNEDKHVGKCEVDYSYPIYVSFDFNYNPITCAVIQHYDGCIFVIEAIKLENSNIYSLCEVIKQRYGQGLMIATGDMSGKSHSAMVKDNMNYFKIIKEQLMLPDSQMKIKGVNPKIEQNQVLVNAIFEHYNVCIDPDKAYSLIYDCKFGRIDNEGKLVKTDRSDPTQQLDMLDCWRYSPNKFHGVFVKILKL